MLSNICLIGGCFLSVILLGCNGTNSSGKNCAVILNSKNGSQMLKLAPNSQKKNYAGIVSCGSGNPVLVGMFDSCLDAEVDKNQIMGLFASYCGSPEGHTDIEGTTPIPTSVGFKTVASNVTFRYKSDGKEVVVLPTVGLGVSTASPAPAFTTAALVSITPAAPAYATSVPTVFLVTPAPTASIDSIAMPVTVIKSLTDVTTADVSTTPEPTTVESTTPDTPSATLRMGITI